MKSVSSGSIELGINIDHVATVRQARRAPYPDPVHAALLAEQSGADNITLCAPIARASRAYSIER